MRTNLGMPLYPMIGRYQEHGGHFFDATAKRFFHSRILRGQYPGADGYYFVTSEQFDARSPRLYTVRRMSADFRQVQTVGEFQSYATSRAARAAARRASLASQGIH